MKNTLASLAALIIFATPGLVLGAEKAKSAPDLTVNTWRYSGSIYVLTTPAGAGAGEWRGE